MTRAKITEKTSLKKRARNQSASKPPKDVDEFLQKLNHPLKAELEAVRSILLGADPAIAEGIKWNAPSFRVQEWFATMNIRANVVQVIFHLGAKVKDNSTTGFTINDPTGLLEWLAKDRATVKFADLKSIKSSRRALEDIVRQWIVYLR